MPKHSLVTGQSCSVQKKGPETPNIGEMTSFRKTAKIGHNAKARGFAKWSVWLKN